MEPYVIERIHVSDAPPQTIADKYVATGTAAIFTDVLSAAPWSRCAAMAEHRFYHNHAEVSKLEAEISVQKRGDIQNAYDFEMENITAEAAMDLLTLRMTEDPSMARTGTDDADEVLYAKLSLSGCEGLMRELDLQSFGNPDAATAPFTPSEHPLLLGPGRYFCWAYIGEAGTGSKTHVDVAASDAFLTVLSGKKEWAMVHPLDKHLVTNAEGRMADLFDIDHAAFPEARRARLAIFTQHAGDCVFVPSDAPHCVRNLEASLSITYNFSAPGTAFRFHAATDKVTSPKPTVATIDLVIVCPSLRRRATLRAYVKGLPAPLPTTDYSCRMRLEALHGAFGVYGRYMEAARTHAVPVGYELCPSSHRAIYYYRMDSADDFSANFGRAPFVSEPYVSDEAVTPPLSQRFPATSSHFGLVPSFPPLRVLINQPLFGARAFVQRPIADVVGGSTNTKGEGVEVAEGAAMGKGLQQFHPCSGADGLPRQWHYARYRFRLPPAAQLAANTTPWCGTFLFYSSHDVHGPVSLHPLLEDATLQSGPMLAANAVGGGSNASAAATEVFETFSPHFEALQWRDPALVASAVESDGRGAIIGANSPLVFDLGDDLIGAITKGLVLAGDGLLADLLTVAKAHGLAPAEDENEEASPVASLLQMGLEKVLVLALYFSTQPRVVGFAYSHTFSTVEEPGTLCLTATAADALLRPLRFDDAAIALSAFCNAIDAPKAPSSSGGSPSAAGVDGSAVPLTAEVMAEIEEALVVAFPHCIDIAGKVRAVKAACGERLLVKPKSA